ncbi:MAG: hypothetical protein K5772_08020 [Clostridia bacterium]|nr:hypothetical protein [Bacillota bacterium]MCR4725365.1 hypothetical protein [Clostridia bacterium]
MSYTIARYALWVLLCIPVAVLGFALVGDLLDGILQDAREKKAKKNAKQKQEQKVDSLEQEYRKSRESGLR